MGAPTSSMNGVMMAGVNHHDAEPAFRPFGQGRKDLLGVNHAPHA